MRVGERMGFAVALALVIVAAQIVTFDLIPTSSRPLWIDKFIAGSFYWVLFVLIQSVVVSFVYFLVEDHDEKERDRRASIMSDGHRETMMENSASIPAFEDENESEENGARDTTEVNSISLSGKGNNRSQTGPNKKPWYMKLSARKFDCKCNVLNVFPLDSRNISVRYFNCKKSHG